MTDHNRAPSRPEKLRERTDEVPPGARASAPPRGRAHRAAPPPFRWECRCQEPPFLLATYTATGRLNIKVRDRYWHLFGFGQVQAICPRCAAEHILDLSRESGGGSREENVGR